MTAMQVAEGAFVVTAYSEITIVPSFSIVTTEAVGPVEGQEASACEEESAAT